MPHGLELSTVTKKAKKVTVGKKTPIFPKLTQMVRKRAQSVKSGLIPPNTITFRARSFVLNSFEKSCFCSYPYYMILRPPIPGHALRRRRCVHLAFRAIPHTEGTAKRPN